MTSGADDAVAAHELDLVTSAAQGDEAAFDRFFERNAAAAQLLVERLLGPGPAADGVVVEAFEKTVRRLPLLGARNSSPRLYVLSTARNGAYAALGRDRPKAPEGALAALLSLPSRQRELLALREIGLDEAECAEVAGIPADDVGVQLVRARLRLTDAIEGTTLSSVFADDRAERLLAAEAVREEGEDLAPALSNEIDTHADSDERFAAALSAVRSSARSVGQLPPVSGASRLAGAARAGAIAAARPKPAAAAVRSTLSSEAPKPAEPVAAEPPRTVPEANAPRAAAPASGDPFDDEIGDEFAWGIVDDDEPLAGEAPPAQPAEPQLDKPADSQWEDGAGNVSGEPPTVVSPEQPVSLPVDSASVGAGNDPALTDPFAGWDDALDWDDDERNWQAGQEPAAGEPGARLEPQAPDPGETRPFDAVAAGLADPDPVDEGFGPVPGADTSDGSEPPRRRRRWGWLIWVLGAVLLFAGVAFAAKTVQDARQTPDRPAESTLDPTSSTTGAKERSTTPAVKKKTTGSGATSTSPEKSSSSTGSSGSSSGGSGASSSSAGSGGSSASGTAAGSSGGTTTAKPSTSNGGTTKKPTTATAEPTVEGGATSSGGAVRGGDTSGGTSP